MNLHQGDIALISIPFTDRSSQKRRPVFVISNDSYNHGSDDVVVVALTSNPRETPYSFTITSQNLEIGELRRPSRVRVDKIYTLSQSIVISIFGRVEIDVLEHIRATWLELSNVNR